MKEHNKRVVCRDGFSISIQASAFAYALPREDNPPNGYTHVECGYPSSKPITSSLLAHAEITDEEPKYTETIYGYVPIEVVQAELAAHGGITEGHLP